jgi:aspartate kinase
VINEQPQGTLVMKFGGSLTADAKAIQQVVQVIHAESLAWGRMVVVVSAMAGVTDSLKRAVTLAGQQQSTEFRTLIGTIRANHLRVVDQLFPSQAIRSYLTESLDQWLHKALAVCEAIHARRTGDPSPRERDAVMSIGERLIVEIILHLIQREGRRCALIDASQIILTDDQFTHANPQPEQIQARVKERLIPVLEKNMLVLMSGFIGATRTGVVTTLGRGGSDYTATLIGAAIRADEVWMWTHREGIMSADPLLIPSPELINVLSYDQMRELAFWGVRIVHPGAIEPLTSVHPTIPLRVRSPFNPDHGGTLIQETSGKYKLKSVSVADGFLVTISATVDISQFLATVGDILGRLATPVYISQSRQELVAVFVIPTSEGQDASEELLRQLNSQIHESHSKWTRQAVKVVAMIGGGETTVVLPNPPLAQSYSKDRALYVIQPEDTVSAVRHLHHILLPPKKRNHDSTSSNST